MCKGNTPNNERCPQAKGYNIKYEEKLMTATYCKILSKSTFQELCSNSFYKAFLQEAISEPEEKLWREASRRRTDPSKPFSSKCII